MITAGMPNIFLPSQSKNFLSRLFRAERSGWYFVFALFLTYSVLPLLIAMQSDTPKYFLELSAVSFVAALAVIIGFLFPWYDRLFCGHTVRLTLGLNSFLTTVWAVFFLFACTAWITADKIPLLAALRGADPDTIAVLREQFLKAREGWQSSFVYVNGILTGALVPYSIALMFLLKSRLRWIAFVFFLIYCVSFVEKAYFLKAVLPVFYLVVHQRIRFALSPRQLLLAMVGILLFITVFSGAGSADDSSGGTFFSTAYVPQGALAHLAWRAIAIPVVTAADAIRVLYEQFDDHVLWGATSSLIAALTGQEHVEYERMVFSAQWGQNETGTGSANSVFITEAFVNFGWFGVILFSLVVGSILRLFSKAKDEAFRALWILFCLGIYTSGLIGLLFSNGFLLVFLLNLLVRFRVQRKSV